MVKALGITARAKQGGSMQNGRHLCAKPLELGLSLRSRRSCAAAQSLESCERITSASVKSLITCGKHVGGEGGSDGGDVVGEGNLRRVVRPWNGAGPVVSESGDRAGGNEYGAVLGGRAAWEVIEW